MTRAFGAGAEQDAGDQQGEQRDSQGEGVLDQVEERREKTGENR
jgi:hypothetical protein